MISSALTLNQKPFCRPQPPRGLEKLETAPLQELGMENCETAADERTSCRRISSVISREPTQILRTRSMVTNSAKALSCAGLHRSGETLRGSGKPLNPSARNCWIASMRGMLSFTAVFTSCRICFICKSAGNVSNQIDKSLEIASGGVNVAAEVDMVVHLRCASK